MIPLPQPTRCGRCRARWALAVNLISTELPHGWQWVTDPQERHSLELELAREMPPEHLLFGRSARLLARHERRNDFLFRIGESEVAQVHLMSAEIDPFWPHG